MSTAVHLGRSRGKSLGPSPFLTNIDRKFSCFRLLGTLFQNDRISQNMGIYDMLWQSKIMPKKDKRILAFRFNLATMRFKDSMPLDGRWVKRVSTRLFSTSLGKV